MGIYNPTQVIYRWLKKLWDFAALYPEVYVMCLGDFLDRNGDTLSSIPQGPSAFRLLVNLFGWCDLQHIFNPRTQGYSWSIPCRGCLLRIDLALCNNKLITKLFLITYNLPIGVSDYIPLLLFTLVRLRCVDLGGFNSFGCP